MQFCIARNLLLTMTVAALALLLVCPALAATGRIQGKLWVVTPAQAANVVFPVPNAVPDATFTTNGIAYIGEWSTRNAAAHCFAIARFLGGCAKRAFGLKYSELPNPNLGGAAATAVTPMGGANYGIIIEFTGTANINNGDPIRIVHDDGVRLMIDGVPVSGFGTGVNVPILESVTFTGSSGAHQFDLLYGNWGSTGDGAWLLFFPALF